MRMSSRSDMIQFVVSVFRREVTEFCALLGCYAASSCNFLPTFRGKLSVPFSRFFWTVRIIPLRTGYKVPFLWSQSAWAGGCRATISAEVRGECSCFSLPLHAFTKWFTSI